MSEIIYQASKGSKFFAREEERDRILTAKIERLRAEKTRLERQDLSAELRRADEYIAQLERSRDLSQIVVHVDCDAFFAAVEELERPELRDVPMAVGDRVLTTCNYHARRFGCRSGMAAFVAKKLCPQLVCIRPNFDRYRAKAREVRAVLAQYDPCFESASIDEAYLNITAYCAEHGIGPEEAVQRMRDEIREKTQITVSAGIAANAKLAKIASNRNKPNGQFYVPPDRAAILEFMADLPVRKVNGIGRVFERELDAIGIKTCGDIYPQRAYLARLFGHKAFQFLIQCYLGLGRTRIQPAEEHERKSVGTESTFAETGDRQELRDRLRRTAEELERDLARAQVKGRTLVLKVKLHTFEVLTRQTVPPRPVCAAQDLYTLALPMLARLEREIPDLRVRLLGLRCSNLVSTKKVDISRFFGIRRPPPPAAGELDVDAEFEEAARRERQEDLDALERLSQEISDRREQKDPGGGGGFWDCPVCQRPQAADDRSFNAHIDFCLSRDTIKEAVRAVEEPSQPRKRKAPSQTAADARQRRLFFR